MEKMIKLSKEEKAVRNERIIKEYKAGKSIEDIAKELGISPKVALGVLIYNKVYKAEPKEKKEKKPSKSKILAQAEVPKGLFRIAGVCQLSTDSILALSELMDGKDRSDFKGVYKKRTA